MITHDLRYGWRFMVRKPGFTAVAVLTLGLGIGANVTMFSWVDISLHRQLRGVADPDRYVALNGTTRTRDDLSLSYPDFVDYRAQKPSTVDDVVAFSLAPLNFRTAGGEPQRVFGQLVSGNYFDTLGVAAALGRVITPSDDGGGSDPIVVLSHAFWLRRFGGDPAIIGRSVTLNGRPFTVVGIAAAGFRGTEAYLNLDMWVPLAREAVIAGDGDRLTRRGISWLEVLVKLAPGASLGHAQADLDGLAANLASAYAQDAGRGVKLYELWRAPTGGGPAVAAMMGVQMAVAGVVLLIACANVANLLIGRAAGRQRETAVRLTLGASRGRLVQQLLTESTLLAAAGGACGVAFAAWTKDAIRWLVPPAPLPIDIDPSLNPAVLAFAVAVTAGSVLVFGLLPALQATGTSVATTLKGAAGTLTGTRQSARVRHALVVAQVALSLVLLVSAGMFVRSLLNAQAVDPGFSTRNGLIATIDLLPAAYDDARGRAFYDELLARVRDLPGVERATIASRIPLGFDRGVGSFLVRIDGYAPAPNEQIEVWYSRVGPDYTGTLGIDLVAGRGIDDRDTSDRPSVGVINETLARRYFAGRPPIGGRIRIGARTVQIVGVAHDGKYAQITEPPRPFLYVAAAQWYRPDAVLIARTANDPAALVQPLRDAVRALDPNVPLFDLRTIAQHLEVASFMQRIIGSVLGAFGVLALVLATIGLYGVIAAIVAQRTAEIGMRMALGASGRDIVALVMRQGLVMTMTGLALGLAGAVGAARLFRSLLIGVSATDATSFAGTTALLLLVSAVATLIPARRAASIDPIAALRTE